MRIKNRREVNKEPYLNSITNVEKHLQKKGASIIKVKEIGTARFPMETSEGKLTGIGFIITGDIFIPYCEQENKTLSTNAERK